MKLKTPYKAALLIAALAFLVYAALVAARIIQYTGGTFNPGAFRGGLMEATGHDDVIAMRVLMALGAPPDMDDIEPRVPPLSVAAYQGNTRAAKLLLARGANPDGAVNIIDATAESRLADKYSGTGRSAIATFDRPLFIAAARGNREMVDLLRSHGARYEPLDALFLGDQAAVHETVSKVPDLFKRIRFFGDPLLFAAIEYRNIEAARALLEMGMDPHEKGSGGDTPQSRARGTQNDELVALFESHDAASN
jgi:ankyrin repeat protein